MAERIAPAMRGQGPLGRSLEDRAAKGVLAPGRDAHGPARAFPWPRLDRCETARAALEERAPLDAGHRPARTGGGAKRGPATNGLRRGGVPAKGGQTKQAEGGQGGQAEDERSHASGRYQPCHAGVKSRDARAAQFCEICR